MKIFVNPSGQRDNVGDSVLRRPYLEALRESGTAHILLTGDSSYWSGLGVTPSDVTYRSRARWVFAAALALLTERSAFALNAGEIVPRDFRRQILWIMPLTILARLRRRPVVAFGVGLRAAEAESSQLVQMSFRALTASTARETAAARLLSTELQPDWAFSLGRGSALVGERRILVLSMRGDRPMPSPDWVASVRGVLMRVKARPVIVVQVRRDSARARELGELFGAQVLDWSSLDHDQQEQELRAVYRNALGVISDRIHVLIFALTEGAVPLGLVVDDDRKLRRTFWFASDDLFIDRADSTPAQVLRMVNALNGSGHLEVLQRARLSLGGARAALREALRGSSGRRGSPHE